MTSPGSIQASLSRWLAAQAFIGLSVVCIGIYAATHWSFRLKETSQLERSTELVRHLVEEFSAAQDAGELTHKLTDNFLSRDDTHLVLRQDGVVLFTSPPLQSHEGWIWKASEWNEARRGGALIELRLGADTREDMQLLRKLAWTLVGAVIAGTLAVSLAGVLIVRRGLRPLKRLAEQTAATGPQYPGRRIDASLYASEIVPWVHQFNAVLERAEQAFQQLESFNADVAHELRTPLANLIGTSEIELAMPRSVEELQDALLSNLEEARRLSAIVTDMLFLSRADRGAEARRSEPVSLAEQAMAVVEFYEAALEIAELQVGIDGDAQVSIDVPLVRRAVSNLVGNAIRYATPRSKITILIDGREDMVWVRVSNQGAEISPDALPNIFKRFYRAERSRSGSSEHHGLGLAIVAAIARMHGGQTHAASGGGSTVISFSIAREAATRVDEGAATRIAPVRS